MCFDFDDCGDYDFAGDCYCEGERWGEEEFGLGDGRDISFRDAGFVDAIEAISQDEVH